MNFDEKAREWDNNPRNIERSKAVADAIKAHVSIQPEHVGLEYGCGTGLLSFQLQPLLKTIHLADTSDGMLQVLKEKIARGNINNMVPMKCDLMSDPLPETRFDLIFSQMTLHHIDDTSKILGLFYRLLNKAGHLCVADIDTEDGSFHDDEFRGHRGFDRRELEEKLLAWKFRNIHFSTAHTMKKESKGSVREYPIFLLVAQKS